MPELELAPLLEFAVSVHEMYLALIAGGFTEAQALRVVANVLCEAGQET